MVYLTVFTCCRYVVQKDYSSIDTSQVEAALQKLWHQEVCLSFETKDASIQDKFETLLNRLNEDSNPIYKHESSAEKASIKIVKQSDSCLQIVVNEDPQQTTSSKIEVLKPNSIRVSVRNKAAVN